MASLNFTMTDQKVGDGDFTGILRVSGEDFFGKPYEIERPVRLDATKEGDIHIAGGAFLHYSIWLLTADRVCVDGHLQWGTMRQPSPGPICISF